MRFVSQMRAKKKKKKRKMPNTDTLGFLAKSKRNLSICLNPRFELRFTFTFSTLFFPRVFCFLRKLSLFTHCSSTVHGTHGYFIKKKYIKNGSYGTIYTFKNDFVTVFSVSEKINCIQTDSLKQ